MCLCDRCTGILELTVKTKKLNFGFPHVLSIGAVNGDTRKEMSVI